jgi:hypothetical protein
MACGVKVYQLIVVVKDSWGKGSDKKLSRANFDVAAAPYGRTSAIGVNNVGCTKREKPNFSQEKGVYAETVQDSG